MNRKAIQSAIADCLNEATETLEVFECLPKRHVLRDRSEIITPVEDPSDLGEPEVLETHLGGFAATVPGTALEPLRRLSAQLEGTDAPVHALATVHEAMRQIDEFRTLYRQGRFATLSLKSFVEAVGAHAAKAREALDAADADCKTWLAALPPSDEGVGVKLGDEWYLTATHIAARSGSTVDAARKLIRELGVPVYRFGRVIHVRLQDFLDATREQSGGEAA